ncbi:MAG: ADOP family duplicated permease [Bryobacteraceae bacterium]
MLTDLVYRLRSLFRRSTVEAEMGDELRFHFEQEVNKYEKSGLPHEEAVRRASLAFGGIEHAKEECREARGVRFAESAVQDLRHSLRRLRRSPGFTAVAVGTLALGIGATAAIFSVVDSVLIRPLPFAAPARLAALFQTPGHIGGVMGWAVTGPDFLDWQRQNHSFSGIAAVSQNAADVSRSGANPEFAHGEKVTANYFDVLGVQASLGRTFAATETHPGPGHVVILSYSLWQQIFGGSPNAIGKKVYINDWPFVVIGVMPANYHDPRTWSNPESNYWIPLPTQQLKENRGSHMYGVFGRLAPGVTFAKAQDDISRIAAQDAQLFPNTNANIGARVSSLKKVSLQTFEAGHFQSVRPAILLLQIAAAMLLLVACANAANLVLSRLLGRQRELGLRAAIGASRTRLAAQLLIENVLLSVIAGVFGLLLAVWFKNLLVALAPKGYLPPTADVHLNTGVLFFTFLVSLLAGILLGLVPVWRASRLQANEVLKESAPSAGESRSKLRVRNILLVAEIATCFVLLAGSGLLVRSLQSLLTVNPGFDPRDFYSTGLNLPARRYSKPDRIVDFFTAVQARVSALPGVQAAGFTSAPPFAVNARTAITAEGHAPQTMTTGGPLPQICTVSLGFFRAAGVPILRGRSFMPADINNNNRTIIVNRAFARYFWPGQNPIGKHVNFQEQPPLWRTVVAVAGDVRQQGLAAQALPEIYLPLTKETAEAQTRMYLVMRSPLAGGVLRREVERQVWDVDSTIPLTQIQTGDEILGGWVGYLRYRTILLSSFGLVTLLISAMGVYGVIAFSVAQRTREIGIRMALGAQKEHVLRMILRQGLKLVFVGIAVGIAAALAMARLLAGLLYGVKPTDPVTLIAVTSILVLIVLLASYVPARRAANVDPAIALHYE